MIEQWMYLISIHSSAPNKNNFNLVFFSFLNLNIQEYNFFEQLKQVNGRKFFSNHPKWLVLYNSMEHGLASIVHILVMKVKIANITTLCSNSALSMQDLTHNPKGVQCM